MVTTRVRAWVFTLNNYTDADYAYFKDTLKCRYIICGKEVGEKKGTPHLQGYIYFDNARTFSAMKKVHSRCAWDDARGSTEDNEKYCSKEGDWFERGENPKQGRRVDLEGRKKQIMDGMRVEDIMMEDPMCYHQYGRTMDKIEDVRMRKMFRTEMTEGLWLYGKTGTGKSHRCFHDFDPDKTYVWPNDGKWWDGYRQQDIVVFNDFRGEIPYNFLLQLIDKWPMTVPRRNREPMPFVSKKIIITSSLPPDKVFKNREVEDHLEQLLRRIKVECTNMPNFPMEEENSDIFDTDTEEVRG